jgi:hypothetical protein
LLTLCQYPLTGFVRLLSLYCMLIC